MSLSPSFSIVFHPYYQGFASLSTPTLVVYYKETTSARNLNHFVKRNIIIQNGWILLVFVVLVLHLNISPEQAEGGPYGKVNYLKRNVFFSCQDDKNFTAGEFNILDAEHVE